MRAYRAAGALACAVGVAAVLLVPRGATAQQPAPHVDVYQAPSLSGSAQLGSTLYATGGAWRGPRDTQASYQWYRCPDTSSYDGCRQVAGNTTQYQPGNQDQGQYLFVILIASSRSARETDWMASQPAGPVTAPTPTTAPTPAPTATPTPAPTATPTPSPGFDIAAPAATPVPSAGAVLEVTKRKAKLLRPFPVVRIRGRLSLTGARVTALTVKAPHRVKIVVTCGGPGCPRSRLTVNAARAHLRPFERDLHAGLWLRVRITKRGYIGKQTVIRIRQGKVPLRTDGCVYPGRRKMQACPRG